MSDRWRDFKDKPDFVFHPWMRTVDELEDQIAELREAMKPFRGFWSDDELKGLPDCHMFEMVWAHDGEDRINEETGKRYPAVTAGQLRRARDIAKAEDQS